MKAWVALLFFVPLVAGIPSGEQPALGDKEITHLDQHGDYIIAAWEDGRSSFGAGASAITWSLYENNDRLRTGTGAAPNCANTGACVSEVVGVFIGPNERFIVASNDQTLIGNNGRLTIGTQQNGITQRITTDEITAFSVSENGNFIAISESGGFTNNISLYEWTGSSPGEVKEKWSKSPEEGPATDIVVNEAGNGAAASGSTQIRFSQAGTLRERDLEDPISTLAAGPGLWSVAGLEDGTISVFGPSSSASPYAPAFEMHPFDDEITAAAWVDDESFFIGDKAGRVTKYWNIAQAQTSNEVNWTRDGVEVIDLDTQGNYLAVLTTAAISLENLDGKPFWTELEEGTELGLSSNGYTSIATAKGVIPYAAVYDSEVTIPEFVIGSGKSVTKSVTIENTGNRAQTFTLDLLVDNGWEGTLPTHITVEAAKSKTFQMEIETPGFIASGNYTAELQVTSAKEPLRSFEFDIIVPGETQWDLVADSATVIGGDGGESIVFSFHVDNNGNEANTPEVVVETVSTWPTTINETWPVIDPQASASGELTVRIPGNAAEGATEHFFVKIDGHDSLEFQVIVGANFGVEAAVPQAVPSTVAGSAIPIVLQITNTGNGIDNYRLEWAGTPTDWRIDYQPSALLTISAGETVSIPIVVETTNGTDANTYRANLRVVSIGDPRFFDEVSVIFPIEAEPEKEKEGEPEDNDTPVGILLPLAALAIAFRKRP